MKNIGILAVLLIIAACNDSPFNRASFDLAGEDFYCIDPDSPDCKAFKDAAKKLLVDKAAVKITHDGDQQFSVNVKYNGTDLIDWENIANPYYIPDYPCPIGGTEHRIAVLGGDVRVDGADHDYRIYWTARSADGDNEFGAYLLDELLPIDDICSSEVYRALTHKGQWHSDD